MLVVARRAGASRLNSYFVVVALLVAVGADALGALDRGRGGMSAPRKPAIMQGRRLAVCADIDDTIKSSGNLRIFDIPLGGIDGQYSRGSFYPGVFDFILELSVSTGGTPEPVAVLTARAKELKFALQLKDSDKVVKRMRESGVGGWGIDYSRVMYGSLHEWVFQDFKGWRKLVNFEKLARNLGDLGPEPPERFYVFLGDTGEKDCTAGELLLARHPGLCHSVFLHCVGTDPRGSLVVPRDYGVPSEESPGRVYFFRTYVGAAAIAKRIGLIDDAAYRRIVEAALRDLDTMGLTAEAADPNNQRRDVLRDIDKAAATVQPEAAPSFSSLERR